VDGPRVPRRGWQSVEWLRRTGEPPPRLRLQGLRLSQPGRSTSLVPEHVEYLREERVSTAPFSPPSELVGVPDRDNRVGWSSAIDLCTPPLHTETSLEGDDTGEYQLLFTDRSCLDDGRE
jgi:hypothetical protein